MHDEAVGSAGSEGEATPPDGQVHPQLWAVNLISDPIHGYIELTKRLTPEHARRLGLAAEEAAEGDLLDSAWLQRMRRISQLQSARWVFPTAEHSRFTHSLGVMHEAGLWARHLYPSLSATLAEVEPAVRAPSEGLVVETLRLAGLLHDVGHGPFAHFCDEHVLCHFGAPADPRRKHKRLTHEDLSQLIIERELGEPIRAIRRAPGIVPERDAGDSRSIDAALATLAPAAVVGRVHGGQPRLRAPGRIPDRRLHGPGGRGTAAPLFIRGRPRSLDLRARPWRVGDVPDRAPLHVPADLLPPLRPGYRPRPGGGLPAEHPGHLRRPIAGRRTGPLCRSGRIRAAAPGGFVGAGRGAFRTTRAGRRDGHGGGGASVVGDSAEAAPLADRW